MIVFAVAFHELRPEIGRNLAEGGAQALMRILVQDAAAVFGHKDQVQVQTADDMSAGSVFHIDVPQAKF